MWHSSRTNGIHLLLVVSLIQQFSLSICPMLGVVSGVGKKIGSRTDLSWDVYSGGEQTHNRKYKHKFLFL